MATGCDHLTFLVFNLTQSRAHFRKFGSIHPFSKKATKEKRADMVGKQKYLNTAVSKHKTEDKKHKT